MKQITRTIDTHLVRASVVTFEGGEIVTTELEPITVFNQGINDDKALKLVQRHYGKDKQYVITSIETTSKVYGLDFNKFMELATIIEK